MAVIFILYLHGGHYLAAMPLGQAWQSEMLAKIEQQANHAPEEAIPRLGKWIRQLSANPRFEDQDRTVFRSAVKTLLSIPGHSEFYEKRIRGYWNQAMADHESGADTGSLAAYFSETRFDFPVLRHLPSPETVRVLGDMVLETGIIKSDPGVFPDLHLASQALQELHHLPLASKPVTAGYVTTEMDLETYRLWYSQIKAGSRTFRFVGDPQEYTLAGPVHRPTTDLAEPGARRDKTPEKSRAEASAVRTSWLAFALAGSFAGVAIWYWLTSKRRA
jgi:hypothetical protein